jgi:hypothetical protein
MGSLIGIAAIGAFILWLIGFGRAKPIPAPEDDIFTSVDKDELAEAEAELAEDPAARPIHEAMEGEDDDEDWGPGSSRSNLPGII